MAVARAVVALLPRRLFNPELIVLLRDSPSFVTTSEYGKWILMWMPTRNSEPISEREDEIFTKLGYIDLQYLVPRIKGKVKMFTGLIDTICPPSSQFAAYNKITSEKDVVIYPDFGHETLPDAEEITYMYMMEMLED